ncbi:hypothetical protein ABT297_16715 [Dactylosporangium sp. NPDC000555]|uniref:hypothetical protein n=1 Tax=Dactylosporangium sp. NPDC000555 TaxID=3154260 RepID=UPI003322D9CC
MRSMLREYFPAALAAFEDLDAPELLNTATDPASAAQLSLEDISAELRRARRRGVEAEAAAIQAALRTPQLTQPASITAAYTVGVRAQIALLTTLNTQTSTRRLRSAAASPASAWS